MGCEGRIWHGDVQGGQSSIPRSAFGRTSVPRVARSQRGARETSLGTMGLRSPSRSLARSLTRGSVPGRDSGQVTRGLLLLPTGGGGVSPVPAWGWVGWEERVTEPAQH